MKILILGNGFLGKSLCRYLSESNYSIELVSRSTLVAGDFFDLLNEKNVRDVIDLIKPDVVINTIWITELSIYTSSPLNHDYSAANINLGEICLEKGIKHFISFGTSAEYGEDPGACNSEKTACIPESVYAKSKYSTYQSLKRMYANSNSRFTWVRIFQPYGKFQDSSRFIPTLVSNLRLGVEIKLRSPNTQLDWISSWDVSRAIEFLLKNDSPVAVDLGTSNPVYNFEVLNVIAHSLGLHSHAIELDSSAAQGIRRFVSDDSFLIKVWEPQLTLQSGLQRLVQELEKN
jgi:nucleoside-diphosphate-sugar epimerase